MTPIEAFVDWLGDKVTEFTPTRGLWIESQDMADARWLSIWQTPAGAPSGDAARINIRVVLTGRRQAPEDMILVERTAQALGRDAIDNYRTACIANIRAMGLPQGPFYSTENRVYYELNFEILMRY